MYFKLLLVMLCLLFSVSNSYAVEKLTDKQKQEIAQMLKRMGATDEKVNDVLKNSPDEKLQELYKSMEELKAYPAMNNSKLSNDNKNNNLDYINNLEISPIEVKFFNDKTYIGTNNVKIKNIGNRTVANVEITFYFKDKNNTTIYEEKMHFIDNDKPLKPNYIYQIAKGLFMSFNNVPDEWQEKNVDYKVTKITFD